MDFKPCKNCSICADICPVKAIDPRKPSPTGFNRDACINFVYFLRERGYAY